MYRRRKKDLGHRQDTNLREQVKKAIVSPQFYRTHRRKIQRLSRIHSRKVKGSNNRERARLNLAHAHRCIVNLRVALAHDLCDHYDVLIFETLNLRGMQAVWEHKINDLAFADFLKKLKWVVVKHVASVCIRLTNEKQLQKLALLVVQKTIA